MTYDLEKYREKREKVLGVKKRGLSFSTLATLVSLIIIAGICVVVVPKSIAYFNNRQLDDAVYKLNDAETWPREVITRLTGTTGVKAAETDNNGTRLVITFDKSLTDPDALTAFFKKSGLDTVMLNQVGHAQRLHTLKKEAKF